MIADDFGLQLGVTPQEPALSAQYTLPPPHVAPTCLSVTGRKFVARTQELHLLDEAWGRSNEDKINVISLIGQGGEGKTAIVLNWYARRARHGWLDASGRRLGHGQRMLQAYERSLGTASAAMAMLRVLGLFDLPARSDLLLAEAERAAPAIPGLTEPLVGLPEEDWLRALDQLHQLALITREELDTLARPTGDSTRAAREAHQALPC